MCGIVGLLCTDKTRSGENYSLLREALSLIQHRGYDGCGIAVEKDNRIFSYKGCGKIKKVLSDEMPFFQFWMGIGHTRYKTSGEIIASHTQPLISDTVALVHNGHIHPTEDSINFEYDSAEIFQNLKNCETVEEILNNLKQFSQKIWGSYSCIMIHKKIGMILFRDPRGIRPLVYGYNEDLQTYLASSETVSLTEIGGFRNITNVQPGEMVVIKEDGSVSNHRFCKNYTLEPCLFCFIYLANPKTVIDGINISQARKLIGKSMGKLLLSDPSFDPNWIDIVVPIPKTSCVATQSLAEIIKKPYHRAIEVNNKDRTFIINGQENREQAVKKKFGYNQNLLQGKNVLLVDDSIVRGTTIRVVSSKLRDEYGCKKIFVTSLSPPVLFPNKFGIDIPTQNLLIAAKNVEDAKVNTAKIAEQLRIDGLYYHNLKTMTHEIRKLNPNITHFESSIFHGNFYDES